MSSKKSAWSELFSILKKHPNIAEYCFYLIISSALFQGYYTVTRTVIPLSLFVSVGKEGVMYYQITSSLALIVGSFCTYHFFTGNKKIVSNPLVFIFITSILLNLTVWFNSLVNGLLIYFVFMFMYEVSYIVYMNYIMVNTPHEKETLSTIMSFLHSATMTLLVIVVILTGKLVDLTSLHTTAAVLAISGPILAIFYLLFKKFRVAKTTHR